MSDPKQTSSTPPAVTDDEGGREARSSSPALPGHIVIAHDDEDGLSFVQRLTAPGSLAGQGEGTVPLVCTQPLTPPEPDSPNPMPPFFSSDMSAHISFLIAGQLALYYYRGQAPLTNAPALEAIAPEETAQTP